MLKVNANLHLLPKSILGKYLDLAGDPTVLSLSIGEPDFATPYHVRQAAIDTIEAGKTFYTPSKGLLSLRKEIASFYRRRYNLDYDESTDILVTIGASEAIELALFTLLNPGDEVIVVSPSYLSYEPLVLLHGGTVITVETKAEDNFRLTPDKLKEKLSDKTRLLILNYPNNPTGAIMTYPDYEALAEVLKDTDIIVLSDEIYSELNYTKVHASLAQCPGMHDKVIVINGFSKTYAMTGWRLGYICAPKEITDQLNRIHQNTVMTASSISQFAGIEALKNGDEDIERMRDEYDMRRRFIVNRLKEIGLPCTNPQGAFYVFADIRSTGIKSEAFCDALLDAKRLALIPGNAFGKAGEGFIRISYCYSLAHIRDGLDRLEVFLNK